eukprot:3262037-Alexandrium_andersonii.AAC.1
MVRTLLGAVKSEAQRIRRGGRQPGGGRRGGEREGGGIEDGEGHVQHQGPLTSEDSAPVEEEQLDKGRGSNETA